MALVSGGRFAVSGGSLLRLILVMAGASCGDPVAPEAELPLPPSVRPWVTGAAAAALDRDGRFVMPDPVAPGPDPMIERSFAADLALAFIDTWVEDVDVGSVAGLSIREYIERGHGGTVDWSNVRVEPRLAYFAKTPYEPLPDRLPQPYRRLFGPQYLVPMYEGGTQVLSLSVAAYSADLAIDERGMVDLPPYYGNEFFPMGVADSLPFRVPLWPEEAVRIAAEATGAKVTEVPELIAPNRPKAPQGARWRLQFDRKVQVRRLDLGIVERVNTVYLGVWYDPLRVVWSLAADEQPASETFRYVVLEDTAEERRVHEVEVAIRDDVPILFVEAEPVGSSPFG